MSKQNKIIEMLGKGLPASTVAMAVGVSESYVSQLLADSNIADSVSKLRIEAIDAYTSMDDQYNSIEDRLLKNLEDQTIYITRPKDILQALKVVNGAKRRGLDSLTASAQTNTPSVIINLTLPAHTITEFQTNAIGQVVEAVRTTPAGNEEKQALITLGSNKMDALLKESRVVKVEDLA